MQRTGSSGLGLASLLACVASLASLAVVACGGDDGGPLFPDEHPPGQSADGVQAVVVSGSPAQQQLTADAGPAPSGAAPSTADACASCERAANKSKKHGHGDGKGSGGRGDED